MRRSQSLKVPDFDIHDRATSGSRSPRFSRSPRSRFSKSSQHSKLLLPISPKKSWICARPNSSNRNSRVSWASQPAHELYMYGSPMSSAPNSWNSSISSEVDCSSDSSIQKVRSHQAEPKCLNLLEVNRKNARTSSVNRQNARTSSVNRQNARTSSQPVRRSMSEVNRKNARTSSQPVRRSTSVSSKKVWKPKRHRLSEHMAQLHISCHDRHSMEG